jgi:DNA-directed RNA polymerase III subunit RPC7
MDPLPVLTEYTPEEKKIAQLQAGFASRMRRSPYYIVEPTKSMGKRSRDVHILQLITTSPELPRFSDKYRPSAQSHPVLRKKDLNQAFFPPEIFEEFFNPKKKRKGDCLWLPFVSSIGRSMGDSCCQYDWSKSQPR